MESTPHSFTDAIFSARLVVVTQHPEELSPGMLRILHVPLPAPRMMPSPRLKQSILLFFLSTRTLATVLEKSSTGLEDFKVSCFSSQRTWETAKSAICSFSNSRKWSPFFRNRFVIAWLAIITYLDMRMTKKSPVHRRYFCRSVAGNEPPAVWDQCLPGSF